MVRATLRPSSRAGKKWEVEMEDGKTIHFGAKGYSDFTRHGDEARKERYLKRHKPTEDWSKSGIETPGFWARHILWAEPSIEQSARKVRERFGVDLRVQK
jgi:hypothetical protein